ncbi:2-hydroxy-3-keto-5-methylthiopentenyl-1-phosphate phosphatase [Bacillus sp. RC236]
MSIQVFCDFDGTITNNDNIMSIMEKFAPPEAEEIKQKILSQELSIQEGVSQLFRLIPINLHDDIIQFLQETAEIRTGFHELYEFMKSVQVFMNSYNSLMKITFPFTLYQVEWISSSIHSYKK